MEENNNRTTRHSKSDSNLSSQQTHVFGNNNKHNSMNDLYNDVIDNMPRSSSNSSIDKNIEILVDNPEFNIIYIVVKKRLNLMYECIVSYSVKGTNLEPNVTTIDIDFHNLNIDDNILVQLRQTIIKQIMRIQYMVNASIVQYVDEKIICNGAVNVKALVSSLLLSILHNKYKCNVDNYTIY